MGFKMAQDKITRAWLRWHKEKHRRPEHFLIDKWVYFWNIRGLGKSQIGRIMDLLNVQFAGIALLVLATYFVDLQDSLAIILLIVFAIESMAIVLGLFLNKRFNLLAKEQLTANPPLREMLESLHRIEGKK